jgi:hypothetical protein
MKSNTGFGGFVDLNNDLGLMYGFFCHRGVGAKQRLYYDI